jgi:hypothetical protein
MKLFDTDTKENIQTAQEIIEDNTSQTLSSPEETKDNTPIVQEEKSTTQPTQTVEPIDLTVFTKTDDIIKVVDKVYFKVANKSSKTIFNIDKTAFAPTKLTLFTRPFVNAYYDQLVSEVLMNRKKHEDVNIDFIMNSLVLYERIKENKYPIHVKSMKYPKLTYDMVQTLNKVFNEYMPVFEGIYQMFSTKVE